MDPSLGKLYVGRALREGPGPLQELSMFFHNQGYSVYMPYDAGISSSDIKRKDMEALRSCDFAVLELDKVSLDVAQELGAARALENPVVLVARSEKVERCSRHCREGRRESRRVGGIG